MPKGPAGQACREDRQTSIQTLTLNVPAWLVRCCTVVLLAYIALPLHTLQGRYWNAMQIFLPAFLLLLMLDRQRSTSLFRWTDWPVWVFVLCLASGVVSPANRAVALHRYLELVTTLVLLYYISKGLGQSEQDRLTVITSLCLFSSAVALYGIWYFIRHPASPLFMTSALRRAEHQLFTQAYAPHFHPALLSNYVVLSSSFAWYLLSHGSSKLKTLGAAALVLCFFYLLAPFWLWRGAPFAFIIMTCFYFLLQGKSRIAAVIASLFLITLLMSSLLFPWSKLDLGHALFGPGGGLSFYRIERLRIGWLMWKDRPFFGVGFDHYHIRFDEYSPLKARLPYIPADLKIADNMYVTLLAETGMVGLGGFLLFVRALFRKGLKRLKGLKHSERHTCLVVSLSVFVGVLISMFSYELFYWHTPFMLLSLVCGLVSALVVPNDHPPVHAITS